MCVVTNSDTYLWMQQTLDTGEELRCSETVNSAISLKWLRLTWSLYTYSNNTQHTLYHIHTETIVITDYFQANIKENMCHYNVLQGCIYTCIHIGVKGVLGWGQKLLYRITYYCLEKCQWGLTWKVGASGEHAYGYIQSILQIHMN